MAASIRSSLSRIAVCSVAVYAASFVGTTSTRPLVIAKLIGLGVMYVAGLVVTREIGAAELGGARKVLGV